LVKLNTNDYTPRMGITPTLAAKYAKRLTELGVAAVELSCGSLYGFQTIRGTIPTRDIARGLPKWIRPIAKIKMKMQAKKYRFKEAYNLEAAATIKPEIGNTPLILVGGMRRFGHMEQIIASKSADLISMSRPFIREPLLVRKFRKGKIEKVSCISCNNCFAALFNGRKVRCYREGLPVKA